MNRIEAVFIKLSWWIPEILPIASTSWLYIRLAKLYKSDDSSHCLMIIGQQVSRCFCRTLQICKYAKIQPDNPFIAFTSEVLLAKFILTDYHWEAALYPYLSIFIVLSDILSFINSLLGNKWIDFFRNLNNTRKLFPNDFNSTLSLI